VVDDDGNVPKDLGAYKGDYEIGDRTDADGKPRRIVEKVAEAGRPEVIWVTTVAEPRRADWQRQSA
jgi:hypothetical protein